MALATVTVRGTPDNPIFDFDIPQGEQGPPGGLTITTILQNTDLDTYVATAAYAVTAGTDAALSATCHLPIHESGTMLVTQSQSNTIPIQLYITNTKGMYVRRKFSGAFNNWRHFAYSRVDQTAGRAIYQFDDVNAREQLIYGDTGVRDVTSLMTFGASGNLYLSRSGQIVELILVNWNRAAVDPGDPRIILTLPSGFKPATGLPAHPMYKTDKTVDFLDISGASGIVKTLAYPSAGNYFTRLQWRTNDAWPTSLPGTAFGTIPNL